MIDRHYLSHLAWIGVGARPVRRIAVVRALYLGDLLLAVPALRTLRTGFPDAEITLIGLPWAASFVRRFSHYLDRFVEFPGYPGIAEVAVSPHRTLRFLDEQRAYGYDLVIQMHGSGRTSNPFALALGGGTTAGYYPDDGPDGSGLTLGAPYPDDRPEIFRNLGLTGLLGLPPRGLELEFPLFDADRAEAAALMDRHPCIGIHAGARASARRWPPERFAAVADYLAKRFDARIVLTGGPDETETARVVANRMEAEALDLAGATSLGALGALIDGMDLFISNDTGPAHIADALDVPSITIVGPADQRRWAPLDGVRHPIVRRPVGCNPCPYRDCPIDHRCLRWIDAIEVIAVAERLLTKERVPCSA